MNCSASTHTHNTQFHLLTCSTYLFRNYSPGQHKQIPGRQGNTAFNILRAGSSGTVQGHKGMKWGEEAQMRPSSCRGMIMEFV